MGSLISLLLLSCFAVQTSVRADEIASMGLRMPTANVQFVSGLGSKIRGVKWIAGKRTPRVERIGLHDYRYVLYIPAQVEPKDQVFNVVIDENPSYLLKPENGILRVKVVLTRELHRVRVYAATDLSQSLGDVIEVHSEVVQKNETRWNLSVGSSLTGLFYRETYGVSDFRISELGLTLKVGTTYALSSKFNLGLSGFGTAYAHPLSRSPSTISESQFYGINARVGYYLYDSSPLQKLMLMLGWYFWGQMNSNSTAKSSDAYGVSNLSGPQIFLNFNSVTESNRSWYSYLKFASISPGSVSISDHEIGVGGGFQISSPVSVRKWFLTFDLSQAVFQGIGMNDLAQHLELDTISLGMSTFLF